MNASVTATKIFEPDSTTGKVTKWKYSCIVSFAQRDDQFLKEWLERYCGGNSVNDERFAYLLLDDRNYARAVVGDYLGGPDTALRVDFDEVLNDLSVPKDKPTVES